MALLEDSSDDSLALALPFTSASRARLNFEAGEERVARVETESKGSEVEDACSVESRSLPLSFSCSFSFAALTLALERKALDSAKEEDCSSELSRCVGSKWEDELELLVAS